MGEGSGSLDLNQINTGKRGFKSPEDFILSMGASLTKQSKTFLDVTLQSQDFAESEFLSLA